MSRNLPLLAAIAVVVSSGAYQGVWGHRWTASREVAAAVARLDRVPREIGDWVGVDAKLDDRELELAEIAGHVSRRYQKRDGKTATILIVTGRTGPISVHSPDVCYSGGGFAQEAPVTKHATKAGTGAQFWTADFVKVGSPVPRRLRIYWSWNANGAWDAPDAPRLFFAGSQALYKLYVITESTGPYAAGDDPAAELIEDLLPVLGPALSPDDRTPPSGHS